MEPATVAGAMVAALLAGLYAGLGMRTAQALDRRAEAVLAAFVWPMCLAGALVGGVGGRGLVAGTLAVVAFWSVFHFPNVRTLETEMPRRFPLLALSVSVLAVLLMLLAAVA